MQSPLLSISYAYDRQQVIYIFDKMRVKVNTQRLYVKCNTQTSPDKIVIDGWYNFLKTGVRRDFQLVIIMCHLAANTRTFMTENPVLVCRHVPFAA